LKAQIEADKVHSVEHWHFPDPKPELS
jgi:hypothetical protein